MEEETISDRCWNKFEQVSEFAHYSPYSICLAADDLYLQSFCNSISQELLFLKSFVKAYESADNCANNDEERAAISQLRNSALHYIDTHDEFVRDLCLELPKESIPSATTEKYADFLLTTVCGKAEDEGVAAYIPAAIAPCMGLYAVVCHRIMCNVECNDNTHIYRKWIDNYPSLEAAAKETEYVLDKLSASLTREEVEEIENIYHQALKLGVEFFATQPIYQDTVVPLRVALDLSKCKLAIFCNFDWTCSVVDSSHLLEELTIATASKAELHQLRNRWSIRQSLYDMGLGMYVRNLQHRFPEGPTFNYKGLYKALKQVGKFQKRKNAKVIESRLLKGLSLEDIKRAGKSNLHDGCRRFLEKIVRIGSLNINVHVISSCWCGELIRSAFPSDLKVSSVHANELVHEKSVTTGEIVRKVESPIEKRKFFLSILKACKTKGEHFTVCIGGSVSDLLCLLEADIGIVNRVDSYCPILHILCDRFGVQLIPLSYGAVQRQRKLAQDCSFIRKPLSGIIYYVDSWAEIEAFILGFKDTLYVTPLHGRSQFHLKLLFIYYFIVDFFLFFFIYFFFFFAEIKV